MLMRKNALIALIIFNNAFASAVLEGFFPVEIDQTSTDFMNVGGGKCRNVIDGGSYYRQLRVAAELVKLGLATEDEVEDFGPEDKIRGCAKLCELEGDVCRGFDWRKNRVKSSPLTDCYFNTNFPTYTATSTSRNNYEDWLCFSKDRTFSPTISSEPTDAPVTTEPTTSHAPTRNPTAAPTTSPSTIFKPTAAPITSTPTVSSQPTPTPLEGFLPIETDESSTDFMNVGGGKCRNVIDGGSYYRQLRVAAELVKLGLATEGEVTDFGQVDKIRGCAKLCELEGDMCKGFDWRKNRVKSSPLTDCYLYARYPTYTATSTSRNNYEDWLCFTKEQTLCDKLSQTLTLEVCLSDPNVCEAKADLNENGRESCDSWCGRSGLVCDKAWNDKNGCGKKRKIPCSKTGKKESICSCKIG